MVRVAVFLIVIVGAALIVLSCRADHQTAEVNDATPDALIFEGKSGTADDITLTVIASPDTPQTVFQTNSSLWSHFSQPMTLNFTPDAVALYPRACVAEHCVFMEELLTFIVREGR